VNRKQGNLVEYEAVSNVSRSAPSPMGLARA
jgi:hypothetical protein